MTVKCAFGCGRDINPHDISSWKQVHGYVGGPKKDSMVGRTDTGKFACTPCIEKLKAGQAPDQENLFEPIPEAPPSLTVPNEQDEQWFA